MASLEIHLLGQFQVLVDGQAVDDSRWSGKESKVLIQQLALSPSREVHREQLIDLLWPDANFESGLDSLLRVVDSVRQTLEPNLKPGDPSRFLLTEENQVRLAAESVVWVDADAFERKATLALDYPETTVLEAALALYTGDLLVGLHEGWASVRREQLRSLYQRMVERTQITAGGYDVAAPAKEETAPTENPPSKRWPISLAIVIPFCLVFLGLAAWMFVHSRSPRIDSLAILPVTFDARDEELASIADGITEYLIGRISPLPGMRVMAAETMFASRNKDPVRVGRELHVAAVMTWRLERVEDNLHVDAQIIRVQDGSELWTRVLIVPVINLTALPEVLGSELEGALNVKLSDEQHRHQARRVSGNPEAYRLYLRGRVQSNRGTAAGFRKAMEYFQKAIDLDPNFALAHVGLADSYNSLGRDIGPPRDYFPLARAAAQRALQIDGSLAEAHRSLAMVLTVYDWDWTGAETEFRRSIELNGGYAAAHQSYGVYLCAVGRFDESRRELGLALELDPRSPIVQVNSGYPYYYQQRYPEAMAHDRRALEVRAGFPLAHLELMNAFIGLGDFRTALGEGALFLEDSGEVELSHNVSDAIDDHGWKRAIQVWLESAEVDSDEVYQSPMIPARLYAILGDRDRCLEWLEQAFEDRAPALIFIGVDPVYAPFRDDPRFQDLLGRMKLSPR